MRITVRNHYAANDGPSLAEYEDVEVPAANDLIFCSDGKAWLVVLRVWTAEDTGSVVVRVRDPKR